MNIEERKAEMLKALEGCKVHKPYKRRSPKAYIERNKQDKHFSMRVWRECASKKFYRTQSEAQRIANIIFMDRGLKLRVYSCPRCGMYHLTKNTQTPW